jgi:hypothetical protein
MRTIYSENAIRYRLLQNPEFRRLEIIAINLRKTDLSEKIEPSETSEEKITRGYTRGDTAISTQGNYPINPFRKHYWHEFMII